MTKTLNLSNNYKSRCFHTGFLVISCAFLILSFLPNHSQSARIQTYDVPTVKWIYRPEFQESTRLINNFFHEHTKVDLYKVHKNIYLPYDKFLVFSGNIYATEDHSILTSMMSSLKIQKRDHITGFGFTGLVQWPILEQKNWAIHLNGKITSIRHLAVDLSQRNRWNFEHQIGCSASFVVSNSVQISLNAYHYRIIEDNQYDNFDQSFMNSNGGFATLLFQF